MDKKLAELDAPIVNPSVIDIVGLIRAKWRYRMAGDHFGILAATLAQSEVAQSVELDRIYDTRIP